MNIKNNMKIFPRLILLILISIVILSMNKKKYNVGHNMDQPAAGGRKVQQEQKTYTYRFVYRLVWLVQGDGQKDLRESAGCQIYQ